MSLTGCGNKRKTTSITATIAKKKRVAGISGAVVSNVEQSTGTITTTTPTQTDVGCGNKRTTTSSITATPAKKKRVAEISGAVERNTEQSTNTITTTTTVKHLPHDLIMEQILSKVPVKVLLRCAAVSKSWYNSIHNDKHLTYSHFLQSRRNPDLLFNLLNVKDRVPDRTGKITFGSHFFKLASRPASFHNCYMRFQRFRVYPSQTPTMELVGYCNGFPCTSTSGGRYKTEYAIMQVYRGEVMYITCTPIVNQRMNKAQIICHGFGFDSLANEYKVVSAYRTSRKELNLIVFTLGTKSWRDVTAASAPISVHGLPVTCIRVVTGKDKQAIFCSNIGSGCLVWKIIITVGGGGRSDGKDNEMEMLLLFNLHDEKFQFIQVQSKGTTGEEQKQLLVDYPHLLEFKGYPCIARIEKSLANNGSDCYNPLRHDRHGSGSCCCCCKVHLYIFKDNVKNEWVKEESFDVCVKPSHHPNSWSFVSCQAPDPCCFCLGSTTTPPTRIFSFSEQIFLYWFDGRHLHVFDLRSKRLLLASANCRYDDGLFITKMKELSPTFDDGDDDIYCSSMDYQLHYQGENFLSLQSFVPEGVEGNDIEVLRS